MLGRLCRVEGDEVDGALMPAEYVGARAAIDVEDHRRRIRRRGGDEAAAAVVGEVEHRHLVALPHAATLASPSR